MSTLSPSPLAVPDRDPGIDAARGLAILGLIFVNIPLLATPELYRESFGAPIERGRGTDAIDFLIEWLVGGKCVAILSFLLGAGLGWQQERVGKDFAALTARRMAVLLGFGLIHMVFLSAGDILFAYGVLGFAVLVVAGCSSTTVRVIAAAGFAVTLSLLMALGLMAGLGTSEPDPGPIPLLTALETAYRQGPYPTLLLFRLGEAAFVQLLMACVLPFYLGTVLLGFDAVRSGWFPRPDRPAPRGLTMGLLAGGLAGCGLSTAVLWTHPDDGWAFVVSSLFGLPSALILAAGYLVLILRLPSGWIRALLASVGRMALSNYLLQSLCVAAVVQCWGLGRYGLLTPAQLLALAVGITALQIGFSAFWLRFFRLGPAEWLWRGLSYGKW